jgi:hypothetical protein
MLYDSGNEPDPSRVPLSVTSVASDTSEQARRPPADGPEQMPRPALAGLGRES